MFKTSQPNSDRPRDERTANGNPTESEFKTLEEFSAWIDEQLLIVESKHDGFQTCTSVRQFFNRS